MSTKQGTGWRWAFAAFVILAGTSVALGAVLTSGEKTAVSRSMQVFNTVGLGNRLATLEVDGSINGATTVYATTLRDGTLTLTGGKISGVTSLEGTWSNIGTVLIYQDQITSCSTVTSTAFTDGTATLTGGNLSGVTSLGATWIKAGTVLTYLNQITGAGTVNATAVTDGTATLTGGNLSGVTSATATWMKVGNVLTYLNQVTGASTVRATALTDGTCTVTGGAVTGTLNLSAATVTYRAIVAGDLSGTSLTGVTSIGSTWLKVGNALTYLNQITGVDTIGATAYTDGVSTIKSGVATGSLNISGATVTYRSIVNGDISASAEIDRSKLALDSSVVYGVPLHAVRNVNGTVLTATTGTGSFALSSGGWGVGTLKLIGETALAQTVTDTLLFEFVLPPEYVASEDVVLQVKARESVSATVSTTMTAQVYESDGNGAVGGNLAAAFSGAGDVTTTWTTFTSVVTDAGLVAGDRVIVLVRVVSDDTGEAVISCQPQIGSIALVLDVRG